MSGSGAPVMFEAAPPSPADAEASVGRDVLERALLDVQRLPVRMDRARVTEALLGALDALAALGKSTLDQEDHVRRFEAANAAVNAAHAALVSQRIAELDRIAAEIAVVRDALAARLPGTLDAVAAWHAWTRAARTGRAPDLAPFRASTGQPALYRMDPTPVVPAVRLLVPEEDLVTADEDALDDDEAEVAPARELSLAAKPAALASLAIDAPDRQGVIGELSMLRRLARDSLEEIGILGGLCGYRPAQRWSRGSEGFEARLLAALDALVALGEPVPSVDGAEVRFDVLAELVAHAGAAAVPDPGRMFAHAFVLSCVEGEDRVRAAVVALRQSHPTTYPAQRDAFLRGSSPAIAPAMARLCEDAPAPLVRVALDVLAARREADLARVLPLLEHPDPGVRLRAVRCLSIVPDKQAAASMLAQVVDEEADTRVVAGAARALVRQGEPHGLEAARELLRKGHEREGGLHPDARLDLLELLGVAGSAADVALLQSSASHRPREAEALGWHGHPAHVEVLLAALERDAQTPGKSLYCAGIARALHRITGAPLFGSSGEPLADPASWRAFWAQHREQFGTTHRHRFGRPYTPLASLDELATEGTLGADRELCILELDAIMAGPTGL